MTDPIVEEVRRHREAYAARFNYDLWAIYEDIKSREGQDGREVVRGVPRTVVQVKARRRLLHRRRAA